MSQLLEPIYRHIRQISANGKKHNTSMLISTTDKLLSDLINASKSRLIQDALISSVQQHQIQLNKVSELKLQSDYLEVIESKSDEVWPILMTSSTS